MRRLKIGAALLAVAIGLGLPTLSSASPATTHAPASFLRLSSHYGRAGYHATYLVKGDLVPFAAREWRVTVARLPGPWNVGATWSYFLHASSGMTVQWIERGTHYVDCYRSSSLASYRCGQGVNGESIGFSYLALPFIPTRFKTDVSGAVSRPGWSPPVARGSRTFTWLRTFPRESATFGPERCITAKVTPGSPHRHLGRPQSVSTWCLTQGGIPVSMRQSGKQAGTLWTYVQLLAVGAGTSPAALKPVGRPRPEVQLAGL